MKVLMLLCVAVAILGAEFASAQEYVLTGSSGTDIVLAFLRESNGKLNLVNKTRRPAPGSVGVTSILGTGPEEYHAFFTWTRPAGTPALGRISFSYTSDVFQDLNSTLYAHTLGSYSNMGVLFDTNPFLFRTQKTPKEDVFFFNVNSQPDPFGPGRKVFDNPTGTTLRSTCFSRKRKFGVNTSRRSDGEKIVFVFDPFGQKRTSIFNTSSPVINSSISDATSTGNPLFFYRELKSEGSSYQTSVFARALNTTSGQPLPAKKVTGPTNVIPGSYEYNTLFFNTIDISDNGRWAFYTKPATGCGSVWELWARRMNPSGGFAGAPFKLFGSCNRSLGNPGSTDAVAIRSLDIWSVQQQ